ncbi:PTS sugar transporter subunit IIA, partial [Oenococcus oeni]
ILAVDGREQEGVTGVGAGIAIPHGKSKSVTRSAVAIAELSNPVVWQSLDNNPVKYVFLLAIPEGGDVEHLKLLSELAGILMDDDVRLKLKQSKSAKDIQAIFKDRGNEI